MARTAGAPSRIYVDEFDFSGRTNNASMAMDVNLPEVTSFSDDGAEFVEGNYNGTISVNGFFDPTDDNYDEQMWAVIGDGADHFVGFYPGNSAAAASIGYELQGQTNNQGRPADVAGAVLLNVTWQNNGAVVRSTVLNNSSVVGTGAVSGSNQNTGTTSAGERFVAVMRVIAFNASSMTVIIEESSDDGAGDAYAAISGMTQTFSAVGVSRESTTAATEAWKRVNVTAFSRTSATLIVSVGKDQGLS